MLNKIVLNVFTYFLVGIIAWLSYSMWEYGDVPGEYKYINMAIEIDHTGKVRPMDYIIHNGTPMPVAYPGDVITVNREVRRFKTGDVENNRFVVDSNGLEYLESTSQRVIDIDDLKISRIAIKYEVPLVAEHGCGAYLYSRIKFDYDYNLITKFFPRMISTPRVYFCIGIAKGEQSK